MNNIIFAGDSFVWGEGLELYIDTPYWINERKKDNQWDNEENTGLSTKQTNETKKFRKENRFVGIIEKQIGVKGIVSDKNGGDWYSLNKLVEDNLNNTDTIIYFLTSIDRNFLHFDINCSCEFCGSLKPKPFNLYLNYVNMVLNKIPIDKWTQSKVDYLEKNEGIPKFNINNFEEHCKSGDLITYLDNIFHPHRQKSIEYQINLFKKWQKTHNLYVIDSWCDYTSKAYIENNSYINSLLIPLKGYNNKWYKDYNKWEHTFPYFRIQDEFPNTQNGHPTLLQHKYIAKSIMEALKITLF